MNDVLFVQSIMSPYFLGRCFISFGRFLDFSKLAHCLMPFATSLVCFASQSAMIGSLPHWSN